ncbi:cytochrome c biogenesis CcdA family protein [Desulfosediminicola flagellatus]|uniref:cytochrome c biogenesis CcdA family protein n=1 Tax=Desulfosediminicola flagellatus TaxID=2569541 RepID=UPI0010AC1928|nr:cytochrome c biogenesis protein CcdA [Desulfosediminicola flagellatus]
MDQLFLTIHSLIGQGLLIGGLGCFLWGVVSVLFSPCHLASIPLIVSYVAGQNHAVEGRKAVLYAAVFTFGLFITIAVIGVVCALLGRMLGDVGPYMSIAVGAILVWVSLDFLGLAQCSMSSGMMAKIQVKGVAGALVLGLAYGVLSGSCTFGFIAPILAIITIQNHLFTGVVLIVLFGLGHCVPIALAGSSTALIKRFLENKAWNRGSSIFRKLAGVCIGALGLYFIFQPFIT